MKKAIILLLVLCTFGCSKKEINYMEQEWKLDESLKPSFTFERSNKNKKDGVFYTDTQVEFSKFLEYVKSLEEKKYVVDWRYSDVDSIKKLEEESKSMDNDKGIFSDGYINLRMCKENDCFFMQWVNKEKYNSINKDKPTSYSIKIETENKEGSM